MNIKRLVVTLIFIYSAIPAYAAEDRVKLETTFIKGNKELPQVLYIVPWQDSKKNRQKQDVIVLHSLFNELFEPVNIAERHVLSHK